MNIRVYFSEGMSIRIYVRIWLNGRGFGNDF